ncbi:MAG: hypothetical protein ACOX6T_19635 [Myxococcales bacterium]
MSELEDELPWGFHDAHLESLHIDWMGARMTMQMRLPINERADLDRRARVTVTGLVYCVIEPRVIDPKMRYEPVPKSGLWLDSWVPSVDEAKEHGLPAMPEGAFVCGFFVQNWNRCIFVCGRDASLEWLEPMPVPEH